MRDEGFQRLQSVIDHSQMVIPNTAPLGKDDIRSNLHRLQRSWDDIIAQMNDGKSRLEAAAAQWELYDDTTEKLAKWLRETDNIVKLESGLQSSLPEKRAQLERVKVSLQHLMLFRYLIKNCSKINIRKCHYSVLEPLVLNPSV